MFSASSFQPAVVFVPSMSSDAFARHIITKIEEQLPRIRAKLRQTSLFADTGPISLDAPVPVLPNGDYRWSEGRQWLADVVAMIDRHYCMNTNIYRYEERVPPRDDDPTAPPAVFFVVVFYLPFWPNAATCSPLYDPSIVFDLHHESIMPGNVVGAHVRDMLFNEEAVRTSLALRGYVVLVGAQSFGLDTWSEVAAGLADKTGLECPVSGHLALFTALRTNTFVLSVRG